MAKLWLRGRNYEYIDLNGDRNIMVFKFLDIEPKFKDISSKYALRIVTERYKNGKIKQSETISIKNDDQLEDITRALFAARQNDKGRKQFNRFSEIDMV